MPHPVVHWEISGRDGEQLQKFYGQLFDWNIQVDPQMQYGMVSTGGQGGINGGIYVNPAGGKKELNAFSCVVGVDNIDQAIEKVKAAGGQVEGEKMDIPGIGTFARCKDTEGNTFTMLQPLPTSM